MLLFPFCLNFALVKNCVCLIFIVFCCIISGCSKSRFTLIFNLPEDYNSTPRIIYYASDKKGGAIIERVAVVNKGKGELESPFVNPAIIYIYPSSAQSRPLAIYAEKGDEITVTGDSSNPYSWIIGGNEVNEELSAWRNANAAELETADNEKMNSLVSKFVSANPESEISPFLLLTSYSRADNETQFRRLWNSLGPGADASSWSGMAARADMIQKDARTPGRLISIALRSLQNGIDTIRPDSTRATMLFFWQNSFGKRKEWFDSIRALSREFPDSSSRVIADVCLEPDSLSWRSALRQDSLKKVARLWVPAGQADARLMNLDVPRVPFFIVFSPDGHQKYRGSETAEAFATFRSLMNAGK